MPTNRVQQMVGNDEGIPQSADVAGQNPLDQPGLGVDDGRVQGGADGGHGEQVVQGWGVAAVAEVRNGHQQVDLALTGEINAVAYTHLLLLMNIYRNVFLEEGGLALEHRDQPFVHEPAGNEVHNVGQGADRILL
jgi:hypothetical protein